MPSRSPLSASLPTSPRGSRPVHRRTLLSAGCGLLLGLAGASSGPAADHPATTDGSLSVFAGGPSGQGYRDGPTALARFSYPSGLALDTHGDLLVADSRNNVIRRLAPDGVVSTLAGTFGQIGNADGASASAQFNGPADVAVDSAGNIFVVDSGNHTIRRRSPDGLVTTLAGVAKQTGATDGLGAAALFSSPAALALAPSGVLYVADSGNNTIRQISPLGAVSTLAGTAGKSGSADGPATAALFSNPSGLALDAAGNLYVADNGNNTIRRITPDGTVSTLAGSAGQGGATDGLGAAARFSGPGGVACDAAGNVFVADSYNNTLRRISTAGVVTTLAGGAGSTGSIDGVGVAARFKGPARLVADPRGILYVTDNNSQIRRITPAGAVTTLAGAPAQSGNTDGAGPAARFNYPNGIAVDRSGNFFVADMDNGTIRKITPAGVVSTFVSKPGAWGNADGTGAAAQFGGVGAIAIDQADNLYVTEFYNHTIRKITPAGVVTTFAGSSGKAGSADGARIAAQFSGPNDIDVDLAGNLYVADCYNHTVRKITPEGIVTTLAGSPGQAGRQDGTGAAARFELPAGVASDAHGNVYVTELANHTVRKITPSGVVTTLAGQAGKAGSADGVGTAAQFNQPWGIALDRADNVYVCDSGNNAIRKITPAGQVTTVVGAAGPYWNLPGRLPGKLAYPINLLVHPRTGDLYVTIPDAIIKVTLGHPR